MIRLSGSVKLRCALSFGTPLGGRRLPLPSVGSILALLAKPAFAAQCQNLHKQTRQRLQMPFAKLADGAEIQTTLCRHRHKIDTLLTSPRNRPRQIHALALGIQQQRCHRMIERIAPLLIARRGNRPQVQAVANRLSDKVCNVLCRHKVLHRGSKQPHLIHVPGTKSLAHALHRIGLSALCQPPLWALLVQPASYRVGLTTAGPGRPARHR
jgi:hypothetical protein